MALSLRCELNTCNYVDRLLGERGYTDLICLTEVKQALFSVQQDLALQVFSEPLNPPLCVVFELSFDKFDVGYLCQKVVRA